MSERNPHMHWVAGYRSRDSHALSSTYTADYSLKDLMHRGFIDRSAGQEFLTRSGLKDFHWELTWPEDFEMPDEMLVDRMAEVQGYVVFVHGWTGNIRIWEELPARVVTGNRRLVALCIDHNGFGASPFADSTPTLESCNPPAAMETLQRFIDLIKIRRQPGNANLKVINMVGHSMGGATLFYLDPMVWNYGEVTRTALAPALLLEDEGHRLFYTALGLGIGLLHHVPVLEIIERFVKPSVLHTLTAGSSEEVKKLHGDQYTNTPKGITGATLMAMGRLADYEIARDFHLMRVMLGHRDPLVGLVDMMDLLGKLEFPAKHVHVVPGTHYMFSIGSESTMNTYLHVQARQMVVEDILALHEEALRMQKVGPRFG